MARALATAGDTAANAVQQVLPSLATAVRVAVETVAAANAAETKEMDRRLSLQMDAGVVAVQQHVDVGLSRVLAHGSAIVGSRAHMHLDVICCISPHLERCTRHQDSSRRALRNICLHLVVIF